jgi:hypothetical protein
MTEHDYAQAKNSAEKRAREWLENPLESGEQQALFQWARLMEGRIPELRLMYHIPNGGLRNKPEAVRLTAEGVRRGVPDICLPVARKGYNCLYIELKRRKGGKVSLDQKERIDALNAQGNKAVICYGFDEARAEIEGYLR